MGTPRASADTMMIQVRTTPTLGRTIRATRRLRRRLFVVMRLIGALFLLWGLAGLAAHDVAAGLIGVAYGLVIAAEPDVMIWLQLRRNRDAFTVPTDITVTERGISRRTEITSLEFGWELVKRVVATDDYWIFVVNRFQMVTLWADLLTPEQVSDLDTFLARRSVTRPAGRRA